MHAESLHSDALSNDRRKGRPLALLKSAALVVASAGVLAQTPVFRTATATIRVDVVVTDSKSRPVTGLTAADFSIEDSGRLQRVTTFSAASATTPEFPEDPADVATNLRSMSRAIAIVVDDGTIGPEFIVPTKRLLRGLVDRLPQSDLISLTYVRFSNMGEPLTTDRDRIRAAIDRLNATLGFRGNIRDTGRILERSVNTVRAQGCARCLVAYISAGFSANVMDFGFAQAAGVPIYTLDPRGVDDPLSAGGIGAKNSFLGGLRLLRGQHQFMRTLAENTGGLSFVGAADLPAAIDTIVSENQSFYLLGYSPNPVHKDKQFHPLNVIVHRNDLKVRARLGYYADPPAISPFADFKAAMSSLRELGDLSLRATAVWTSTMPKNRGGVAVAIQVDASSQCELSYRAIADSDGHVTKQGTLAVLPERSSQGGMLFASFDIPLDTSVLRLGVFESSTQRGGVVSIPLDRVFDPAKPSPEPRVLGLAIVESADSEPNIPLRPLLRREFRSSDTLHVAGTLGPVFARSIQTPALALKGEGTSRSLPLIVSEPRDGVTWVKSDVSLVGLPPGNYVLELASPAVDGSIPLKKRLLFRVLN